MNGDDKFDLQLVKQTPSEILDLLAKHLRDGTPCEILYEDDSEVCDVECFVVSIHSDFIVLGRLSQTCCVNGWKALRLEALLRVSPTDNAGFILRALAANRISLPLSPPIDCPTFLEFLRTVCEEFPIVTMGDDPTLVHPSAAGTILEVNAGSITIRAMSIKGFWAPEPHTIELRFITWVYFGSRYEQTLERIAMLPDT